MINKIKDVIDIISKIAAGAGVLIAALSYSKQIRIKHGEWLQSLFEKFFENENYKEVRSWLDYSELHEKLNDSDEFEKRKNEEKFTDFLNFYEFIGILHFRKELNFKEINVVFDYYLKKIKDNPDCQIWIDDYGFEKLKILLDKILR